MDKPIITHGRIEGQECVAHALPKGIKKPGDAYGMDFLNFARTSISQPLPPYPRYFEFYCISHMIDGRGFYWQPRVGKYTIEPGQGVIMPPNVMHCYGGDKDRYIEDTVCFWGSLADSLAHAGMLQPGVVDIGSKRRLLPIIERILNPSIDSQAAARIELQKLVLDIYLANKPHNPKDSPKARIAAMIDNLQVSPESWWTVSGMAKMCGMNEIQFRRIFKQSSGISPKTYVEQLKMRRAAEMLSQSMEPVASIAKSLSYSDPLHFSRRFKLCIGMSPLQYRKSILGGAYSRHT